MTDPPKGLPISALVSNGTPLLAIDVDTVFDRAIMKLVPLVRILLLWPLLALAACEEPYELQPGEFRDCDECPIMVEIPPGSFMMGSPEDEVGRDEDEGPLHKVMINYRFAVSKYEVSVKEWWALSGREIDYDRGDDQFPVENVDWNGARSFARHLSNKTGMHYRLLSEAEWEYVARAGTTGPFNFGKLAPDKASYNSRFSYEESVSTATLEHGGIKEVGSYPANGFGIHDLHGNVAEWVEDCYRWTYEKAPANGQAITCGDPNSKAVLRILRGGSSIHRPELIRSASRYPVSSGYSSRTGVRLARKLD